MKRSPNAYAIVGYVGGILTASAFFSHGLIRLFCFIGSFGIMAFVSQGLDDPWTWHDWTYFLMMAAITGAALWRIP